MMANSHSQRGFTLVELSIVLVILGLLVGGVLTGQSLIRASELRAIMTEQLRYVTAVNAFRDKYFSLPGDMTNATSVWTSGTVNGNGDGVIPPGGSGANTTGEAFQFWNQLNLAGLIEGKYSGLSGAAGANDHVIGTNCPKSKLNSAGWGVWSMGQSTGDTATYVGNFGNTMVVGAYVANGWPSQSVFKPEDAWNIDTKMDDGKPGTGRLIPRENGTWSGATTAKCTTSTSNTDYAGTYNLTNTNVTCSMMFIQSF